MTQKLRRIGTRTRQQFAAVLTKNALKYPSLLCRLEKLYLLVSNQLKDKTNKMVLMSICVVLFSIYRSKNFFLIHKTKYFVQHVRKVLIPLLWLKRGIGCLPPRRLSPSHLLVAASENSSAYRSVTKI